ncbi:MAG: tRNA uridine 5-carboxymethylaminomethyl modification enzyme [Alteromonas naphthalenivorans]|jgi:tRNA uridine 5-carboxymethylaminomethyl modification enzyme
MILGIFFFYKGIILNSSTNKFDVIIVGGGHAGIEAASAAARMGSKTALITLKANKIGYMPCNPAIGGIGKGHIVFEISALGGLMPKLCTKTYLQARMLNTKKGPAVHGLRLQIDKEAYAKESQKALNQTENLTILEAMVDDIVVDESQRVTGVKLNDGTILKCPTVVLTTGTFLNGLVHVGLKNYASGREDEPAVTTLTKALINLNLKTSRLKTGTPPRLLKSTIDFSVMDRQELEDLDFLFELEPHIVKNTHECYITHTNESVHNVIKKHADESPILRKDIGSTGPRYCPSIEDKVIRFPDKSSHQIFVEPESANTDWIYPNGISTSLPEHAQEKYIQAIKGFENAKIVRPGYAIEYDIVLPNQLKHTLEVKSAPGLFLAGQINGTTGYEEAAGQGLMAGANAHLVAQNLPAFTLSRSESYIGVMIDDITTLSIDEPYRMFTSRAERRLLLRQDNAFARLTPKAHTVGLVTDEFYKKVLEEEQLILETIAELRASTKNAELLDLFTENIDTQAKIEKLTGKKLHGRLCQTVQANIKYEPYLAREEREVQKLVKHQTMILPKAFDYINMIGLSKELQQKLTTVRPATIAQAGLISGMTPAALSFLILQVKLLEKNK